MYRLSMLLTAIRFAASLGVSDGGPIRGAVTGAMEYLA